jgi:hypothetical protein
LAGGLIAGIFMAVKYAHDNADNGHFAKVAGEAHAMLSAPIFTGAQLFNAFP